MNSGRWLGVLSVLTAVCVVHCSDDKAGTNPSIGGAAGVTGSAVAGASGLGSTAGVSASPIAGATASGMAGAAEIGGAGASAGSGATPMAGTGAGTSAGVAGTAGAAAGTGAGASAGAAGTAGAAAGTGAGTSAGSMAMPTAGTRSMAGSGGRGAPTGNQITPEHVLLGVCEILRLARDPGMCTGLEEVMACGKRNCNLDACATTCQDFLTCATELDDPCMAPASCDQSQACNECMVNVQICSLATTCRSMATFTCASTEDGGACNELESCCMTQTDPVGCMGWLDGTASLMGDAGCAQLIGDPDFIRIYLSDPPCM